MAKGDLSRSMGIMHPGRAVMGLMALLGFVWFAFAVALNWVGVGENWFLAFAGSSSRILSGQVWRLFTAPLLHAPGTVGHILSIVIGLFFLAPRLEDRWGAARFIRFFFMSSVFAYLVQMVGDLVLPASIARRLVGEYWFGSIPALTAVAVAWALTFRGETVRLWFVLPISSTGLVIFIGVVSFLRVVAAEPGPEGLLSPFGGMVAGWLFGGGTPSPIRRMYLRLRLAQLDREARGERGGPRRRRDTPLRVIEGGRGRTGSPEGKDDKNRHGGPGGRMLH